MKQNKSVRVALGKLAELQREFAELAHHEPDPTNSHLLANLFNTDNIRVVENGLNSFEGGLFHPGYGAEQKRARC